MAEVRKKVIEDKYNTKSIKTTKTKKQTKKIETSTKKVGTSSKKKEEKKGLFAKFRVFCNGVKSEFLRVHWPSKKDMVKYSIATIIFVVFCGLFFYAIDIIFALIKSLI